MFIENALKIKNDSWRYVVGCFIIFIATQIGSIPFAIAIFEKSSPEMMAKLDPSSMMTVLKNSNLTLFYVLLPYLAGMIGILVVSKYIHEQNLLSLTNSRKKLDYNKIFHSFSIAISIVFLSTLFSYIFFTDDYIINFEFEKFVLLFFISLIFLPIQTSWEEYVFRGYLMQGIGVLSKNRWTPLFLTSLMFGLLHYWNPEITKLGSILLIHYVLTGLFFGVLTLMDDGMELSLGFHAGNNFMISILVTADWTVLQTDSILKSVGDPKAGSILLPVFFIYPLIILYFSKKYNWKDWNNKLFGKISLDNKI